MTSPSGYFARAWLVDSSGFFALVNNRDDGHPRATDLWRAAARENRPLVTTNFVIAEAHALMLNRWSHAGATAFVRRFATGTKVTIERVTEADEARALDIIFRHTDKDSSMVDALSFAVMDRLGIKTVLGFDRDFLQYGFAMAAP